MKERIGFIGTGAMGLPMATRLARAGYPLGIYARRPEAAQPLVALGASLAASPAALARASDVIMSIVTTTADVEQIWLGEQGVVHGSRPNLLVVDMSTISPGGLVRMAHALARHGIDVVDAPVSGGPGAAAEGTLAIMAGGSEQAFARARPLLGCLGRTIVHVGAVGAGQGTKACNQLALCVALEGAAEALALAGRLGLDPGKVREALLGGYAASRVLEHFGARMVARDFAAGVEARLHHKDLGIVLGLAQELGLAVPGAAVTAQSFNRLIGSGGGREDSSALLRVIEGEEAAGRRDA